VGIGERDDPLRVKRKSGWLCNFLPTSGTKIHAFRAFRNSFRIFGVLICPSIY